MFGGNKIKIEKELLDRLKKAAELAGYSSVDEFVVHVLEKELDNISNCLKTKYLNWNMSEESPGQDIIGIRETATA